MNGWFYSKLQNSAPFDKLRANGFTKEFVQAKLDQPFTVHRLQTGI